MTYITMNLVASGVLIEAYSVEDKGEGKIIVRPECYFDKNGKRTATYKDLVTYITNVYYVLLTRGIKGTYLYVCDDNLREYLSYYMELEN